jgi:pimeloyl-ACP methyl ester carboxylesterase
MAPARKTLTGLGIGLAAAGAAAAAGVVAERATRGGRLETGTLPTSAYDYPAGQEAVVIADDGVPLHVEIDEPEQPAVPGRPTIVLSHGYCLSLRSWVLQRRALAKAGYRLVLWDQRSHGRSGHSAPEHCTIDQLGRDLKNVIDAHAPDGPLILVGHSMGGMTTMSLAGQFPEVIADRVVAVGLVATSAGGSAMVSLGFGPMIGGLIGRVGPGLLSRLGRFQNRLDAVRKVGRGVEDVLVARYSFDSPMSPEAVRFVGDMIFATPFSVMGDFLPSLESLDQRASLAHFGGIDCLVLNGMGDLLTPPEHSAEIVRLVPGAEHVVIKDAGHIVMLEHPEVVNEQLLDLALRGQRAASAHLAVMRKPRVKRVLTDLTRLRRKPPAAGPSRMTPRTAD